MSQKEKSYKRELYSRSFRAGSRQYYIDAKVDNNGGYYLVISEARTRQSADAQESIQKERQRVFVYAEDLSRFVSSLNEVVEQIQHLSTHNPIQALSLDTEELSYELEE